MQLWQPGMQQPWRLVVPCWLFLRSECQYVDRIHKPAESADMCQVIHKLKPSPSTIVGHVCTVTLPFLRSFALRSSVLVMVFFSYSTC